MKLKITLLCLAISAILNAQTTAIPDANFEQALIDQGIDTNGLNGDALSLTFLDVSSKGIVDLEGINSFVNLTYLNSAFNSLNSVDVSGLINLETLNVQTCSLVGVLDLANNTNLRNLYADNNQVSSVSFSTSNLIENINLDSSNLIMIDVSSFSELFQLDVGGNVNLSSLNVSQNPKLQLLSLENTQVTSVDLTQNLLLEYYYHGNVPLGSLDLSSNTLLKELAVFNSNLTTLILTDNEQLERLWMGANLISYFDYSVLPNLKLLNVYDPHPSYKFTTIDLANNLELESLNLSFQDIENVDLSANNKLTSVFLYNTNMTTLNLKNGANNILQTISIGMNSNLSCVQVDNVIQANQNVTNSTWYKDAATVFSEDCSTLSVQTQNIEHKLTIYPNPAVDVLNVKSSKAISSIELSDINGKTIYKTNEALQQLDMSTYNSGLYFLKIETEAGVSVKKVVKE